MKDYTIGITTFSKRIDFVSPLIKQIRSYTDSNIILAINGDYKEEFKEDYRKKILKLCLSYDRVYPIFFIEQRSLSKMWNTILIHSETDYCLILNDDIKINSNDIFRKIIGLQDDDVTITTFNNSYSHFICDKKIIDELGYFDERLLGFGEEDGDIKYRYVEKFKEIPKNINVNGLVNIVSPIRDENIKRGVGKYSKFNRDFVREKYTQDDRADVYLWRGKKWRKNIEDYVQYPYEKFYQENKDNL